LIVAQHILDENDDIRPVMMPSNEPGEFASRLMLQIGEAAHSRMLIVPLKEHMVLGCSGHGLGEMPDLDFSAFNAAALGMSPCHAAFSFRDDLLFIEDLNSAEGTRINGLMIPTQRRYRLRNGDELEFGRFRMSVRVGHVPTSGQFR
jgi:hypothetical protein